MAQFLRTVRKAKWIRNPKLGWLGPQDIQADALGDLRSTDNSLSLYIVNDDSEEEKLRVAAALALTRDHIANVDFVLVEEQFLASIKVKVEVVDGETPDDYVNKLHRDLSELSASQIYEIAKEIARKQSVQRLQQAVIIAEISKNVAANKIDISKLKTGHREKFAPATKLQDELFLE